MAEELVQKVKRYIERTKNVNIYSTIESYPLETIGYWIIIGAPTRDDNRRPLKEILHGKFVDAIAYAIQHPEFYDKFSKDTGDCSNGTVEKIQIHELEDSNLLKILSSSKKEDK